MDNEKNKRPGLYAVSNAHLDTQWNWTVKDTIRDCILNTMDYNFALFEKYPSYKINFEGAFRYRLMKEYYPEKYEKVKHYVKTGNWVPVGSTWDAMDVNVPSSEALMRQVLYGNNFYEEEFGVLAKDIFLPDCFGFRHALPSIAAHMGLTAFSTQKLVWGVGSPLVKEDGTTLAPAEESDLPRLDLGRWRGPDGNEIFVSLLSGNYTYNFDDDTSEPLYERKKILDLVEHNRKVSGVAKRNLYFGTGDYGGSCSDGSARLLADAVQKRGEGLFDVLSATPTDIYDDLTDAEKAALPVYDGGLLIPHGYGAMTSHTAMKRLNRQNECAADICERICAFAEILTGIPYPKQRISEAWKHFLWHQFHDDLTGTSIAQAYLYSHNDMVLAQNIFQNEGMAGMARLAALLDSSKLSRPVMVYNPVAFERKEAVRIYTEDTKLCSVCDAGGNLLDSAVGEDAKGRYISFVPTLPSLSLNVFGLCEEQPIKTEGALYLDSRTLENEFLRVRINENGDICSVWDKTLAKEMLIAPICEEIYEDNSTVWPSWEYNFDDLMKEPKHAVRDGEAELLDLRPVSVGLRITKRYGDSRFVNEITLAKGSDSVRIDTKTDWHEQNSLLLARFPFAAENESAVFDGGLGFVKGQNTNEYPYFIHNVHRYADLSDKSGAFGVTLSNDCKYAMTKPDDNTLSVVLIHTPKGNFSPESGQNFQDHGENVYSFTLTPHSGSTPSIRRAEMLNLPVWAQEMPIQKGSVASLSLMDITGDGVEVRALKKEEKGENYILRLQECLGQAHTGVSVEFPVCRLTGAFICDGYERKKEAITLENGKLSLDFTPFEVKTVMLSFERREAAQNDFVLADLPYNADLLCVSGQTKSENGVYLPTEQLPSIIESAGISYRTGADCEKNVLACNGQTLTLSGKRCHVRLLMAAKNKAKNATFTVDGKEQTLRVLPLNAPVGSRPMAVCGSGKHSTLQEIAHVFTHTKNASGEDNLYDFAYLFAYDIETGGATELTLPNDPEILIFAATETDLLPARPLGGPFEKEDTLPKKRYRLTAKGCKNGSGEYEAGATALIFAPELSKEGLFEGFEGEGILYSQSGWALVKIPEHDITVKANYRYLGRDLAAGKPCSANHCMNRRESSEKALDGKPFSKWCGVQDENGLCLFTVDLEEPTYFERVLIGHAGGVESDLWNTVDFEVQVRNSDTEDYRTVISVKDNKENVTLHTLTQGVTARYVRLYITKPAHDGDRHARIYHFRLYSGENQ